MAIHTWKRVLTILPETDFAGTLSLDISLHYYEEEMSAIYKTPPPMVICYNSLNRQRQWTSQKYYKINASQWPMLWGQALMGRYSIFRSTVGQVGRSCKTEPSLLEWEYVHGGQIP